MRPLTDSLPKPLVPLNGKPLIDYQLEKLSAAGVREAIVNVAYLGEQVVQHLERKNPFNLDIQFSREPEPLETGGALHYAQALIGDDDVLLVNGDVWSEIDYAQIIENAMNMGCVANGGAHLVLVENPSFKSKGDFSLEASRVENLSELNKGLTFSGVSVLSSSLLRDYPEKRYKFPLKEIFDWGIAHQKISGEMFTGYWNDVGTPERLKDVENYIS